MTIFLFAIFINSLYCIGLNKASAFEYISKDHPELGVIEESKNIFWKLRFLSLKYFGKFYSKPLFTCPACMASVHSLYLFWPAVIYLNGFHYTFVFIYLIYVFVLSATNYIISELIDLVESLTDYLRQH